MTEQRERMILDLETNKLIPFFDLASTVIVNKLGEDELQFLSGDPEPLVFGATGSSSKLESYALATGVFNPSDLILPPRLSLKGKEEPDFADAVDVARSKVEEIIGYIKSSIRGKQGRYRLNSEDGSQLHIKTNQDIIIIAGDVVHFGVGGGQLIGDEEGQKDRDYFNLHGVFPLRPQTNLSRNLGEINGEKLDAVVRHLQQTFSQESTVLAWDVALAMGRLSTVTNQVARVSVCDRYVALFGRIPHDVIETVFRESMPDPLRINSRLGFIENPLLVPYMKCLVRINQNGLIDGCGHVDGCDDPRAYLNDFGTNSLDMNLLQEAQVAIIGNVPGRFIEVLRQPPSYNGWKTI